MDTRIQITRCFKEMGCYFSILFWTPHYKRTIFLKRIKGKENKYKRISIPLNDPLFVLDKLQSHLPPFPVLLKCDYQQFPDLQRETWMNSRSLTVWFFEFLEMCRHFHLEVNLTALLSSDLECHIFSFPLTCQILSWRFCLLVRPGDSSFPRGLHTAAALGRQNFTSGFTDSGLCSTAQHQDWRDFTTPSAYSIFNCLASPALMGI